MAVAMTVTELGLGTVPGAVYSPVEDEIPPPPLAIDHMTGPVTLLRVALKVKVVPMITDSCGPVMVTDCAEAMMADDARAARSSFDFVIIRFPAHVDQRGQGLPNAGS